jgi:hypothetical protein
MPRRIYAITLLSTVLSSLLVGMALNALAQRIEVGTRVRGLDLVLLGAPLMGAVINLVYLLRWPPGSKEAFLGLKPE